MAKTLAITVHPAPAGADYLSVADAMRQILDLVEALDRLEGAIGDGGKIVWRLKDAHTNSPPFTVVAEATPADPTVSVALEANRVTAAFHETWDDLLENGTCPEWVDSSVARLFKRVFERNLNGIGRTDITFDDNTDAIHIVPHNAQRGVVALARAAVDEIDAEENLTHTEYGSVEGEVCGLITYYNSPAIILKDRLMGNKITCTLSDELASLIGPSHIWSEAWGGRRVLIGGAIHYDASGRIRKLDADTLDEIDPSPISLADLEGIDILGSNSIAIHLEKLWGVERG